MASTQNAEEAANIVSEFMSSLDNIPLEVSHLLQEIRLKDVRSQEINDEILKDQARFIKHTLRDSVGSPKSPTLASSSRSVGLLPSKITAAYASLDQLSQEKISIAKDLEALLLRTANRLDLEASKVRALQGLPEETKTPGPVKRQPTSSSQDGHAQSRQVNELRNVLTADLGGNEPAQKRRRVTATSTPLRASPAPIPLTLPSLPYAAGNTTQRARSSTPRTSTTRAVNSRSRLRQSHTGLQDEDADAEGDDDPDADAEADPEEEEDLTLYCVCRKTSYGDMIGCDNPDCPYQWFHVSCVGVETPLPEKWFCPECTSKGFAKLSPESPVPTAVNDRKRGRK